MLTKLSQEIDTSYTIRHRDSGAVVITAPDGRESDPIGYQGIAKLDNYMATSDYFAGVLPKLFKVVTVIE